MPLADTGDLRTPLTEILTPDELAMLGVPGDTNLAGKALGAEDFRLNAWDMYGEGWVDHVPFDIQTAFMYLFGKVLWAYQLAIWYCPFLDIQVHGARGSGKTEPLAMIAALLGALYPGNDIMIAGPSKDQVLESKESIETHGRHSEDGRDFMRLFRVHDRNAPQADMWLRPWDQFDPGTRIKFRSARGTREAAELLRSAEAGWVFFDEFGREYDDSTHLQYLAGCRRGPNHWLLSKRPDLKQTWTSLGFKVSVATDEDQREKLEDELEAFTDKHGLAKQGFLCAYGNVGWNPWIWERYEEFQMPERYAVTWYSHMNPAFTRQQRKEFSKHFGTDEKRRRMEMFAERPPPPGNTFSQRQIDLLFSNEYTAEIKMRAEEGVPGYIWKEWGKHGVIEFGVPPEYDAKGHPAGLYAGGGDPGSGMVSERNAWTVFVVRIDVRPMELVYFRQGNLSYEETGSIKPWLNSVYHAVLTYPMMQGNFAAEASGPQKGVDEVAFDWAQVDGWEEHHKLVVWPLQMQSKGIYIQETQLILAQAAQGADKRLLKFPHIKLLEAQMGQYLYPEPKKQVQDLVMGLISLGAVVWQHCASEAAPTGWAQPGDDKVQTLEEYAVQVLQDDRDTRLADRDYRDTR